MRAASGSVISGPRRRQRPANPAAVRGERLAQETQAVGISERTDALTYQGDAVCDLAEVLRAAGRGDEATSALGQALERYGRKKNLALARQVRARLAALHEAPASA